MRRTAAAETTRARRTGGLATALRVAALAGVVTATLVLPARGASANVTFNQRILELVNRDRVANGLTRVAADPALGAVAEDQPIQACGTTVLGRAKDMGVRNYFDHKILGCGLLGVTTLLNTLGISLSGSGENIGWMNGTTDPVVAANNLYSQWMGSDGHRRNILNPLWTRIGVGSWSSSPGQTWSGGGFTLANVWIGVQLFSGGAVSPTTTTPPAPAGSVSPSSLSFGSRVVGTASDPLAVTLANGGSATLNISSTSLGGANVADFAIASSTCGTSVAPGGSCSISVRFTPGVVGARSANLWVADNASGSPRLVTLSGTGTTPPVLGTPTDVRATGGDGEMSVTWTAPASGATTVGYGVFAHDATGYTSKSAWVCGTCTSAVVTGLGNGKSYMAVVQAYDGAAWGAGGQSNWTTTTGELSRPANIRSVSGDGTLTVTWGLPSTPEGGDGYGVFVYDTAGYTGKSAWVCATCGTAKVSGLTNGESYSAVVYPHDGRGWGPSASTAPVVVGTVGPPANVVAVKGTGSVNVSWTAPSAGGAPLAGYGVFVYEGDRYTGISLWACATCTTGHLTGLINGRQYTVLVYGYNAYGWGSPTASNPVIPS
jgi:uncharacterized protein YkwD